MKRSDAISHAEQHFDSGEFQRTLARRIAVPTESQNPERAPALADYLDSEMRPAFEAMGFTCQTLTHPKARAPFLFAQRLEDTSLPTVFGYGHGDVIRGLESEWQEGLSPWRLTESGGRWYGRGMADNKGQHSVNMGALRSVLETRGRLGFNAKYLIEMGEETGSTGLRDICSEHKELFKADLLLASDGPRLRADRPTIFLGSRGSMNFDLTIEARKGGHHSGNWGGLISNPGIQLAHAIASIVSATGQIRIPEWVPRELPASVRRALADCEVDGGADGPADRTVVGRARICRRPSACLAGVRSKCLPSRRATRTRRSMRFRRARGRAASFASWSASMRTISCRRCDAISTARGFRWCRLR